MKRVKIEIEGMTCSNCEKHVESELKRIGAKKIKVSHGEDCAIFNIGEFDDAKVKTAVNVAGYKPGKIYVKEEKGLLGGLFR